MYQYLCLANQDNRPSRFKFVFLADVKRLRSSIHVSPLHEKNKQKKVIDGFQSFLRTFLFSFVQQTTLGVSNESFFFIIIHSKWVQFLLFFDTQRHLLAKVGNVCDLGKGWCYVRREKTTWRKTNPKE